MNTHKKWIAMAAAAIAFPTLAFAAASYSINVRSVSNIISFKKSDPNRVRGTMTLAVNGSKSDTILHSYWNGGDTGSSGSTKHQCPELIQRYARTLGFKRFKNVALSGNSGNGKLPALGNGDNSYAGFAAESDKGFKSVKNGSPTLPKPGAVISISGYADGAERIPGGHVGIAQRYATPGSKTTIVKIPLFDQNMPNSLTDWRPVEFRKDSRGNWKGYWINKGREHLVTGWADPSS